MTATAIAAAVRERPILFSGEMVRAILDGRKTQTRRVVVPQPPAAVPLTGYDGFARTGEQIVNAPAGYRTTAQWSNAHGGEYHEARCPFGRRRDRLWVRERHAFVSDMLLSRAGIAYYADSAVEWRGDAPEMRGQVVWNVDDRPWDALGWRPSIHMPRWASRLTLELTEVRVERLQAISDADVLAEGVTDGLAYVQLWDSLNAARGYGWDADPWVWALTVRRVEG